MRPEILFSLYAPVTSLNGVGPKIANLIARVAGDHIVDLLWHLPSGLIDRRYAPKLCDARTGVIATLTVNVIKHIKTHNRRQPYKIVCSDDTGVLTLVFFHAREDYLRRLLPEGEERVVSGLVEGYGDELQITHPDHVGRLKDLEQLQSVEPVYPLTQGLSLKVLSKAVKGALAGLPELPEWLDKHYITKQNWPAWRDAVLEVHSPENEEQLSLNTPSRERLAYDEVLANQLALALVRSQRRRRTGRSIKSSGDLRQKLLDSLPFSLTPSQVAAVDEITADLASEQRMHRLLQGDVGSGKTVVALLAMAAAIEAGHQAALLAPTEILARQHFATIEPLARAAGISIQLYTGRDKGTARAAILEGFKTGSTQLAVGTHALFQEGVEFKDLAFSVIDEQHRFGVHQRLALSGKGEASDVLVMTATPIPRTLTLTAYGDMESSRLTEKPEGRQPIDTRTFPVERLDEIVSAVQRTLAQGAKIYWICPLVEESEALDLAAAEDRYAHLKQVFGAKVGLVHGKMKGPDKDAVMQKFAGSGIDILVATTVVEVGVDVREATVMVIEHAERFGLAQLHQLRGRIGRGAKKSTCMLLYGTGLSGQARERLKIMRETDDGFRIAEEDLRLRGAGELMGTRQSGLPVFKIADLMAHSDLLLAARDDAKIILEKDPELQSERGRKLRVLLYLFERDEGVRLLRS